MLLKELAFNIKHIAEGGQGDSDDSVLSIRQIEFWIHQYRAIGVKQATDYGKDIDASYWQDLGVVPLSDIDKSDSNCPDVPFGCEIKKIKLPKLVDFPNYRGLWVGLIDKQTPFVIDDSNNHIFKRASRFGQLFNRAYMIGDTLYVVVKKGHESLEYINVRGVFEDPHKVNKYPVEGCDPVLCNFDLEEYPMAMSLNDFVTKNILSTELNMTSQTINDILNNAKEDGNQIGLQVDSQKRYR